MSKVLKYKLKYENLLKQRGGLRCYNAPDLQSRRCVQDILDPNSLRQLTKLEYDFINEYANKPINEVMPIPISRSDLTESYGRRDVYRRGRFVDSSGGPDYPQPAVHNESNCSGDFNNLSARLNFLIDLDNIGEILFRIENCIIVRSKDTLRFGENNYDEYTNGTRVMLTDSGHFKAIDTLRRLYANIYEIPPEVSIRQYNIDKFLNLKYHGNYEPFDPSSMIRREPLPRMDEEAEEGEMSDTR